MWHETKSELVATIASLAMPMHHLAQIAGDARTDTLERVNQDAHLSLALTQRVSGGIEMGVIRIPFVRLRRCIMDTGVV